MQFFLLRGRRTRVFCKAECVMSEGGQEMTGTPKPECAEGIFSLPGAPAAGCAVATAGSKSTASATAEPTAAAEERPWGRLGGSLRVSE